MHPVWVTLLALGLLSGCATAEPPAVASPQARAQPTEWLGRLSVTVQSEPPAAMSARFLLQGDARNGSLDLYSPLGTTVAALQWSPQRVQLQNGSQFQTFDSLTALTEKITGAALPMAAIFEWLQGQETTVAGWQTHLSDAQPGSISARRLTPLPEVTLRIKLD